MKSGLSMAWRMIGYHLVMLVISLLFLWMMGENYWLQLVLNAALLVGYGFLLYNDGGANGEKAATLSVALDRQREEGRGIDPKIQAQAFSKKTAVVGYIFGVLPLLLIALVNLAVEPLYPAFVPAPRETEIVDEAEQTPDAMPTLAPEAAGETSIDQTEPAPAEEEAEPIDWSQFNWVNVIARIAFAPYIFAYTPLENNVHTLYLLFMLFALAIPVLEPIGYLQGPRLRQKKLVMIEKGKKKKMRNLRVNKKPRTPKKPKMEV